jgi:radical SAM superfamily enzyme
MMVVEETTAEEETRDDPVGFHEVVVLSIGTKPDCIDFGSTAARQARLAC